MEGYKRAFNFFDINKDGCITFDELEKAMAKCGQKLSKLELRVIMSHGDNDRNGVITFEEFIFMMKKTSSMRFYTFDQLYEHFRMFDKDNDGYIRKEEMVEFVKKFSLQHSFPDKVIEDLFNEADIDKDGRISFEEFILVVH